jgi:uncharacterized protein involved in tellurium resistance
VSIDHTAPHAAPSRRDVTFLRRRAHPTRHQAPAIAPEHGLPRPTPSGAPLSTSLDLPSVPEPMPPGQPVETSRFVRPTVRIGSSDRTKLGVAAPMVTLNRLQSGIGALVFEALCSDAMGDLRLGCAYTLTSGHTSTVQHSGGRNTAPVNSRKPVIVATRRRYEQLTVDLRQNVELSRMVIYGFSESGQTLRWGGTLVVATLGGARIELPLDHTARGGVVVFLSAYNVDGELVIRAEMEKVDGTVRDACHAYGFDRITWLNDMTPVD